MDKVLLKMLKRRPFDIAPRRRRADRRLWPRVLMRTVWCAVVLGSCTMLLYEIYSPPYLHYPVLPVPVLKETLHPGEPIPVLFTRCNSKTIPKVVASARELINVETGSSTVLESRQVAIDPGCKTVRNELASLPLSTKPGSYYIRGTTEISEVLATKVVRWETTRFSVTLPAVLPPLAPVLPRPAPPAPKSFWSFLKPAVPDPPPAPAPAPKKGLPVQVEKMVP